ncbi:MAG: hypothetical protein ACI89E_002128, partial [Planctomycetota bacterium]
CIALRYGPRAQKKRLGTFSGAWRLLESLPMATLTELQDVEKDLRSRLTQLKESL